MNRSGVVRLFYKHLCDLFIPSIILSSFSSKIDSFWPYITYAQEGCVLAVSGIFFYKVLQLVIGASFPFWPNPSSFCNIVCF